MTWRDIFLVLRYPGMYAEWAGYRDARVERGKEVVRFRPWLLHQLELRKRPVRYTDDIRELE